MAGHMVKYSEAFKQQVIEEIERGRFSSAYRAAEAYGVRGKGDDRARRVGGTDLGVEVDERRPRRKLSTVMTAPALALESL